MKFKNWKGIYEKICWDWALVLWKKNLPGGGLTKVEKHCDKRLWSGTINDNLDKVATPCITVDGSVSARAPL